MAAKKVDLKRLADALTDYPFAYLITVDDDHHVHTVTVEPVLRGLPDGPDGPRAVIEVGLIGGRTRANLASHGDATLLWPPPEPGGYSLIVDGRAEVSYAGTETAQCAVLPTKALLHRNADSAATASGCLHDCVVFSEPS
ncbi:pyridoxamine 5'-phosphate oxidase family protein [Mycobacterium ulcerans]|uniref:Pyridoxamine 5'-phosphate oxidase family protein n=1 Tax=Mycobacterium ulcerans TaxID=1809 RepID=A0ABY3VAB1_MYCUL|nr:pyridoxamine 5'-phosphate oxidase family protein [Mycobacterium ulcerans]MEB3970559.1 pyridoxamine 5'-phosphate oxidase family protein [Mycobacterium ulcerans]MEB3978836.1 pyridoxamine 5'-phosphate oxidase family protein [Mycobacterium ulcerans]MEB4008080.1 pyridoxamine 5'-phosphate oxidase family protein [Mycobacterium ulcerans]MEB4417682.1 pyridoxamine 5'-phosphate oxidase family protein [Mycobacterium ulcerans]MEB4435826.1 pyridoxamine 5'-phosphate oxidase family protein [Mycobacterium u